MGEANGRGTPEQRKTEAILRNKIEYHARLRERAKIEAAKTPEQRAGERNVKIQRDVSLANLFAIAEASSWNIGKRGFYK